MAKTPTLPKGMLKSKWLSGLLSLIVGLLLGTTLGNDILQSAGVPKSCVRAIQRADRAINAGESVADNGKQALTAARDVRVRDAIDLLREAATQTERLFTLAARFEKSRQKCNEERK
jgi:hypothetical protein